MTSIYGPSSLTRNAPGQFAEVRSQGTRSPCLQDPTACCGDSPAIHVRSTLASQQYSCVECCSHHLSQCSTHEHPPRFIRPGCALDTFRKCQMLLRKEVIQPHLPVRLPCYDLVLITDPTFDGSLLAVRPPASGVTDFHDLTGGVYKARERIHRGIADPRLLATPTS